MQNPVTSGRRANTAARSLCSQWETLASGLLLGIAVLFVSKIASGTLDLYIGGQYRALAFVSIVVIALQLASLWLSKLGHSDQTSASTHAHDCADGCCHSASTATLARTQRLVLPVLAISILLGLLVPPKILDAAAIGNRDISGLISPAATVTAETKTSTDYDISDVYEPAGKEPDPLKRNILQWRRALSAVRDPVATFSGQPVDLVGFVYFAPANAADQFTVTRYVIRCCVADATPLGLVVQMRQGDALRADDWVRVRGVFVPATVDGQTTLVIQPTSIEPIEPPAQPYINGMF